MAVGDDIPEIRVVRMPILDTGIGREAGFRDDAELIEAWRKEREAMDPAVREILERFDDEMLDAFLFGEGDE